MSRLLSLIFFLAAFQTFAQVNRYTRGAENGFAWQSMENPLLFYDDSKYTYLSSILARYSLMQESYPEIAKYSCRNDVMNLLKEGKSDEVSLDDMVTAIDKFYRGNGNKIIPIIFAYCYCIKEIAGLSKNELKEYRKELLEFSRE